MRTRLALSLAPCVVLVLAAVACEVAEELPKIVVLDVVEGGSVVVDGVLVVDDAGGLAVSVDDDRTVVEAPFGAAAVATKGTLDGIDVGVQVNVQPLAFTRLDVEGPAEREHGAMVLSADAKHIYVVGGGGYPNFPEQAVFDDAWDFDVDAGAWSPWAVSGDVPGPGASRRVAQLGNDAYLYGGYVEGTEVIDEFFHLDVATGVFTAIPQRGDVPGPRALHTFGADVVDGVVVFVVFGGFGGDVLGDTVVGVLDGEGVAWTALAVPLSPSPRYGSFFGVDHDAHKLALFSGAQAPAVNDPINAAPDAWTFDFTTRTWFDLLPNEDDNTPPGRRNGCGVFDDVTGRLFVFGGTADAATTAPGLFALDIRGDGTWQKLTRDGEPPLRSSSFGAPLPEGGIVCGFGNDDDTFHDLFFLAPSAP